MRQLGLTLIELLVGLVLLGVVGSLALPAFGQLIDSQRQMDMAQQLTSGLRMARTEAILRSLPVIMQAVEDDWSRGWSIFVDANQNQLKDSDETVLAERPRHRNVRVAGNSKVTARIGFDSTGRPLNNANGTLGVCLQASRASAWQVAVAVTGRISLRRESFNSDPCA